MLPEDKVIPTLLEMHRVCKDGANIELVNACILSSIIGRTIHYGSYDPFITNNNIKTIEGFEGKFYVEKKRFDFAGGLNPFNYIGRIFNWHPRLQNFMGKSFLYFLCFPIAFRIILKVKK